MNRRDLEKCLITVGKGTGYLLVTIVTAFPFYWMFLTSVRAGMTMANLPGDLWVSPWNWDFSSYRTVLFEHDPSFLHYMWNSFLISAVTVLLTVLFSTMGAYAVTRLYFKGKRLMGRMILLVYMFPAIVLVVPLFAMFSWIGLRDTHVGLILVYLAQTLPVALYLMKSYFDSMRTDVEEVAMMDGLSRWEVIWKVTVPMSLPTIVSVALYTFIITWNEFLFAFIFLDTPEKFTLPIGIIHLAESIHSGQQMLAAAAVIATVPVIALFMMFERYLVKGLTEGGTKG